MDMFVELYVSGVIVTELGYIVNGIDDTDRVMCKVSTYFTRVLVTQLKHSK